MIVRSQDKKMLVNLSLVTDIIIKKIAGMYGITVCYPYAIGGDCANVTIAKYSTEEKAIKALDKIYNHIESEWITFEMPQDKEV